MTSQSGGGSGYPGVTGDGLVPPGLAVSGQVAAGHEVINADDLTDALTIVGVAGMNNNLLNLRQSATAAVVQLDDHGSLSLTNRDNATIALTLALLDGYTGTVIRISDVDQGTHPLVLDVSGNVLLLGGIGLHGHIAQATPRTLAQATITAMTDANAKTAVQACADTLDDIGALTLT